jgi:hypothetical protein
VQLLIRTTFSGSLEWPLYTGSLEWPLYTGLTVHVFTYTKHIHTNRRNTVQENQRASTGKIFSESFEITNISPRSFFANILTKNTIIPFVAIAVSR